MKELTKEKVMTTRELAEQLGTDKKVIIENAKKYLPNKIFEQGKPTYWNEAEITVLIDGMKGNNSNQYREKCSVTGAVTVVSTDLTPALKIKKAMSLDDVAEIFGYDSEYLRKKCAELGFTQNGKKTMLNEEQATILKSCLVPRTSDMKIRGQNAVTHLEMLQNIQRDMQWLISYNAELQRENEAQKAQLLEQMPKVEFFDDVTGSNDTIDMKEAAKILSIKGIGRNKLFEILREKKILDRNNQPYQKYVDLGYFRIIESKWQCGSDIKITLKTVVFQKGLDFIRNVVKG